MEHKFLIKDQGVFKTYIKYEDIPYEFDHLIEFVPYMPPPPHSPEDHEEIESWMPRFQELIKRQRFK